MQNNQSGMQEAPIDNRNFLTDQSGFTGEPEKAKVSQSTRQRGFSESDIDL